MLLGDKSPFLRLPLSLLDSLCAITVVDTDSKMGSYYFVFQPQYGFFDLIGGNKMAAPCSMPL